MKIRLYLLLVFIGFYSLLNSTIWHIKLDGTGDFTTIQEGINASVHSDTVLVYPGTYYENVFYVGKNITVASLEILTGDEQYIYSTIIDGQRMMSSVSMVNEETDTCLRGFTITNGQGWEDTHNIGGGVTIYGESDSPINCDIINCVIYNNFAYSGAGIACRHGNLFLSGTTIRDNYATFLGGGLSIEGYSEVTFDPDNLCNLYNNYASSGLEIYVYDSNIEDIEVIVDTFTVQNPTRYFAQYYYEDPGPMTFDILNHSLELVNQDLYVTPDGDDANSGLSPDEPMKTINLAIRKVVSDSLDPKTIHLAQGTYSRNQNQQLFALGMKSHLKLTGNDMGNTFLDGENVYGRLMFLGFNYENIEISNLSFINAFCKNGVLRFSRLKDIKLKNLNFYDNYSNSGGIIRDWDGLENLLMDNVNIFNNESNKFVCGAQLSGTINAVIKNCSFVNNSIVSDYAWCAGLHLTFRGNVVIENCVFKDNYCENWSSNDGYCALGVSPLNFGQGDIYISNTIFENNTSVNSRVMLQTFPVQPSKTYMSNCTIVDNSSEYTCSLSNITDLSNTIIRNDCDSEIVLWDNTGSGYLSELTVNNCDILGGIDAIYNTNNANIINWGEGNIDEDPLFSPFSGNYPYQLTSTSPCVDAGTPDTTGLFLPPWDLLQNHRVWDGDGDGTAIIDMGCYEYAAEPYVGIINDQLPVTDYLLTNYPNPFNPVTTIVFNLPKEGEVQLDIYNIKGQKVKTLLNDQIPAGEHSIVWDGTDENNKLVSSGIYLYKLNVNGKTEAVRKCLLLK